MIPRTIVSLWREESSKEKCIAQSNWLIDNLYLELQGLFKTIDQEKPAQNDRQLAAMTFSGLIDQRNIISSRAR